MDPVTMAMLGMAAYGAYKNIKGNKKDSSGTMASYTGAKPPSPNYLRPAEDLIWNILKNRSQGIDVGYDPARRTAQEELIRSQLGRREEDEIRQSKGIASGAGLSGNLRAQEAMQGRVSRDIGRTYGEALSQISIEDLARANQERDINTARLQGFNEFNFGQSNKVADFDYNTWLGEQGLDLTNRQLEAESSSDLLKTGLGAASLFMGNKGGDGASLNALMTALNQRGGTGIGPSANIPSSNVMENTLLKRSPNYARRMLVR